MDGLKVGRVVHYVAYGTPKGEFPADVCRAAIVTEVTAQKEDHASADRASLCVLNPSGIFFNQNLPEVQVAKADKEPYTPGTWHDPRTCPR